MTIAQIEDRGSALAWSPISSHTDVIALGSKDSGSIGFDDVGGDLELYDFNITGSSTPQVIGSTKTSTRFASIGWTHYSPQNQYGMGLIAGGMVDGTVQIWNPASILAGGNGKVEPITTVKEHSGGAVTSVAFNPHLNSDMQQLLATGGSNGEVLITSLERPENPDVFPPSPDQSKQSAEITNMAWNSQVPHILASATGNGTVQIWDLRQKKPWCDLRCEHGGIAVSDLAWNPTEGLHILTASGDDRNPVMKLWDLQRTTSHPLATLEGHTGGILSVDWCPHDASLLLSCGNDNRTILWDLYSLQPIDEINDNEEQSAGGTNQIAGMYGGNLGSSVQRRYDVKWSPLQRGVVSTCSFDRKVQAHSVIGAVNKSGRPPSWLKRPSGVSCGFGGSVISFGAENKAVKVNSVVEEPVLKKTALEFDNAIASRDFKGYCRSKAEGASHAGDAYGVQLWEFMQIIFDPNARMQILNYLGFDPVAINQRAMEFNEDHGALNGAVSSLSLEDKEKPVLPMSKEAEDIIKQALLVGDFEAAVECCFRSGNLADALVLSSCGGAELWAKTQAAYFSREAQKRPFLSVVSAVIHNQLGELVAASDPTQWQETLAILSTYGKSEEFPSLCLALGDRLDEAGDSANASLCYMCALNLDRAAKHWNSQLNEANRASGSIDVLALHSFVEKVTIFMQAPEVNAVLNPSVAPLFASYAKLLAEQGLLEAAAKYCTTESQECNEMRDRLYNSGAGQGCKHIITSPPPFPFYRSNVGVAPKVSTTTTNGAVNSHQQSSQQSAYQAQQTSYQQPQPQTNTQRTNPDQLPPNWMALQDPASGMTYYANQATGETSWEKPASQSTSPAHPVSNTVGVYHSQQQGTAQQQQQAATNGINGIATTSNEVVSRYGDGFVSSASHPELGQQYGNIGTSNPYHVSERPGIAAVSSTAKAPVSGTFDPNIASKLKAEHQHIAEGLLSLVSSLSSCALSLSEKKQLSESEKAVSILLKKTARGEVDSAVVEKVNMILTAAQNKDYAGAGRIQKGLVDTDWSKHKDWLKGVKFLIQLATKKQV
eukprot:CAMPEP_0195525504 /NCGR_PEP_ID=MMETSP0794_2-20130614/25990_1 /TAXON_ID=515487 /ORGANISM="Stephanopyxis turris, Strain CCMP 815" /LENGTH=1054 /DNA_ID=CAMNT_0040655983 /DNA_START=104 /DNA_END=3268 /DNA_ORIENTATION=+